jgi:hypothetical protein
LRATLLLRFFLTAKAASDIAEGSVGGKGLGVNWIRRFFPGFGLLAILRGKNFRALQIFIRVNVLGFFLLRFFAGVFLPGGTGNILRGTLSSGNGGTGENSNTAATEEKRCGSTPHGRGEAHRGRGVYINS